MPQSIVKCGTWVHLTQAGLVSVRAETLAEVPFCHGLCIFPLGILIRFSGRPFAFTVCSRHTPRVTAAAPACLGHEDVGLPNSLPPLLRRSFSLLCRNQHGGGCSPFLPCRHLPYSCSLNILSDAEDIYCKVCQSNHSQCY